jgi:hypothetical protein
MAARWQCPALRGDLVVQPPEHVKRLEERLGARLLNRTTRNVSLTEAGRVPCCCTDAWSVFSARAIHPPRAKTFYPAS